MTKIIAKWHKTAERLGKGEEGEWRDIRRKEKEERNEREERERDSLHSRKSASNG